MTASGPLIPPGPGVIVAIMALAHAEVATLFGHLAEHRLEEFFAGVADEVIASNEGP